MDRRDFLRLAGAGALVAACGRAARANPCDGAKSTVVVVGPREPGNKMRVTGRVFRPDGKTAAAGVILHIHHTDARGVYNDPPGPPRLQAWIRTAADGSYRYDTIRPAPYPGGQNPAHVHTQLWGPGVPPQWGTDLQFLDDPLVSQKHRDESRALGTFAWVVQPVERKGVLECVHNIRLKSQGDQFEPVTRFGLNACGVRL
jgi:protocatechuate 3,4-dioxygenase beta subunit